eukprot:gnl/TRDRNA2_/TRDRNA2_176709_c8_seq7.p1 gnl/TRDRNA2_/TRDRNA2_176709_c8~~gnl/TRDRNA2_/TRDRNA2_176709_c8_seq7.p1  ORF type:complete len:103 (+),score=0.04 gnl/TRDRNA2_/TRDRNA2_176709_c8_seq7:249-557(+)
MVLFAPSISLYILQRHVLNRNLCLDSGEHCALPSHLWRKISLHSVFCPFAFPISIYSLRADFPSEARFHAARTCVFTVIPSITGELGDHVVSFHSEVANPNG